VRCGEDVVKYTSGCCVVCAACCNGTSFRRASACWAVCSHDTDGVCCACVLSAVVCTWWDCVHAWSVADQRCASDATRGRSRSRLALVQAHSSSVEVAVAEVRAGLCLLVGRQSPDSTAPHPTFQRRYFLQWICSVPPKAMGLDACLHKECSHPRPWNASRGAMKPYGWSVPHRR